MEYTTVWNRETIKAWKASVAHWERLASGNSLEDETMFADDCALCTLFIEDGCMGCPVAAATGCSGCYGSPWAKVIRAFDEYDKGYTSPAFLKAAKRELKFLKSLRPEKDK